MVLVGVDVTDEVFVVVFVVVSVDVTVVVIVVEGEVVTVVIRQSANVPSAIDSMAAFNTRTDPSQVSTGIVR